MVSLWQFDLQKVGNLKEMAGCSSPAALTGGRQRFDDALQMGWTEIQMRGKVPSAVSHHQSVLIGKAMYLVGGSSFDDTTSSNASIHKLDLSTHLWDVV